MDLGQIQREAHKNSTDHGFWSDNANQNIPTKLMLIVTEVAEAMEEYRDGKIFDTYYRLDGKPEGFATELADVIIRVADLAEWFEFDLERLVLEKMEFNKTREHMHGKTL